MFKLRIVWEYIRTLVLKNRFNSREALLKWQEKKIKRHLQWVLPRSAYYRKRFETLGIGRWRELPVSEKRDMMAEFSDFNTAQITRDEALSTALEAEQSRDFSPELRGVTVGLSSGTSGHRGLFLVSARDRAIHAGSMLASVLPGPIWNRNRVAFFLRANSNLYSSSASSRLQFQFFDLMIPVKDHAKRLSDLNPTIVFAPPSVLIELAKLQQAGAVMIHPKRIYSVAEVLDPLDQANLERVFKQTIHQVYQCTEGFLGITCQEGTLHLNETSVAFQMEWIDEASGKFHPILTDFRRRTQPMIRYLMNDILTLRRDPCPCGSPELAIEMIEGRADDVLEFPALSSESMVSVLPDFVRRCFLYVDSGVEEYRVYQPRPGHLEIYLQCKSAGRSVTEQEIQAEIVKLAHKFQFKIPTIEFQSEFVLPKMTKLRRVEKARP
ncbi:MAG: adenylate cyclase [Proteobacteria bacterium]|nr:MAG: adenylate cyclase [Pseudomonadota bacterium]